MVWRSPGADKRHLELGGSRTGFKKEVICRKESVKWTQDGSWIPDFPKERLLLIHKGLFNRLCMGLQGKDTRLAALISYHASPLGPQATQVIPVSLKIPICRTEILLPAVNVCKVLECEGYCF